MCSKCLLRGSYLDEHNRRWRDPMCRIGFGRLRFIKLKFNKLLQFFLKAQDFCYFLGHFADKVSQILI